MTKEFLYADGYPKSVKNAYCVTIGNDHLYEVQLRELESIHNNYWYYFGDSMGAVYMESEIFDNETDALQYAIELTNDHINTVNDHLDYLRIRLGEMWK